MRTSHRWIAGVAASAGVVAVGLMLVSDRLIKAAVERGIEQETGLRAEIGTFEMQKGAGIIRIQDLKLRNSAEFDGALMAHIPEAYVEFDTALAVKMKLHFKNIRLNFAQLNILKNGAGQLNLDGVGQVVRERQRLRHEQGTGSPFEFAGIDRMELTLGQVVHTDLQHPGQATTLDLGLKDEVVTHLKTVEDIEKWTGALVFKILMRISLGSPAAAR